MAVAAADHCVLFHQFSRSDKCGLCRAHHESGTGIHAFSLRPRRRHLLYRLFDFSDSGKSDAAQDRRTPLAFPDSCRMGSDGGGYRIGERCDEFLCAAISGWYGGSRILSRNHSLPDVLVSQTPSGPLHLDLHVRKSRLVCDRRTDCERHSFSGRSGRTAGLAVALHPRRITSMRRRRSRFLNLLPSGPTDASWLTDNERRFVSSSVAAEQAGKEERLFPALRDPRVSALAIAYGGILFAIYGFSFWLPLLVQTVGFSTTATGFVVALLYVTAAPAMILWARFSDRRGERIWHPALAVLVAALGLLIASTVNNSVVMLVSLALTGTAMYSALTPFYGLASSLLSGPAMAGGIALINMVGGISGRFCRPICHRHCPRKNRQLWTRIGDHCGFTRRRRTDHNCAGSRNEPAPEGPVDRRGGLTMLRSAQLSPWPQDFRFISLRRPLNHWQQHPPQCRLRKDRQLQAGGRPH